METFNSQDKRKYPPRMRHHFSFNFFDIETPGPENEPICGTVGILFLGALGAT